MWRTKNGLLKHYPNLHQKSQLRVLKHQLVNRKVNPANQRMILDLLNNQKNNVYYTAKEL